MKKIISLLILLSFGLLFIGCGPKNVEVVDAEL